MPTVAKAFSCLYLLLVLGYSEATTTEGDFCNIFGASNTQIINSSFSCTSSASVCAFPVSGLVCNGDDITSISFNSPYLTGTLPSAIASLTSLTYLDLYSCDFSSTIPAAYSSLTKLTNLDLGANFLDGTIPTFIGTFIKLNGFLDLGENNFNGHIPTSFGALTGLQGLYLDQNSLDGPIPSEIGLMTNLHDVFLDKNSLAGLLPTTLANLSNLEVLDLDYNELNGSFPVFLAYSAPYLRTLQLDHNHFSGGIPQSIGLFQALEVLTLANNDFTGYIPETICNLHKLTTLTLTGNDFTCYPTCLTSVATNDYAHPGSTLPECIVPTAAPTIFEYSRLGCPVELFFLDKFGDGWGEGVSFTAPGALFFNGQIIDPSITSYAPSVGQYGFYETVVVPPSSFVTFQVKSSRSTAVLEGWEIYWTALVNGALVEGSLGTSFTLRCLWESRNKYTLTVGRSSNVTFANQTSESASTTSCDVCPHPKPPPPKTAPKGSPDGPVKDTAPSPKPGPTPAPKFPLPAKLSSGSVRGWFDGVSLDTSMTYTISDESRTELLFEATSCKGLFEVCESILPDGSYVLRVTGNTAQYQNQSYGWSFCGTTGGAREEVVFHISEGKCFADEQSRVTTYEETASVVESTDVLEEATSVTTVSAELGFAGVSFVVTGFVFGAAIVLIMKSRGYVAWSGSSEYTAVAVESTHGAAEENFAARRLAAAAEEAGVSPGLQEVSESGLLSKIVL